MAILPFQKPKEPVVILPEQKRQKKLLFVLIAVVFAIILVLYFGFSTPKQSTPIGPAIEPGILPATTSVPSAEKKLPSPELIKIEFDIFNEPKFQALKPVASKLDISGEKGRTNPFLPH